MIMKGYVQDWLRRRGLNDTQIALATLIADRCIEEGEREEIDPDTVAEAVYEKYKDTYG